MKKSEYKSIIQNQLSKINEMQLVFNQHPIIIKVNDRLHVEIEEKKETIKTLDLLIAFYEPVINSIPVEGKNGIEKYIEDCKSWIENHKCKNC